MAIELLNCTTLNDALPLIEKITNRHHDSVDIDGTVQEILNSVREKGDEYLLEKTREFDCKSFATSFRVSSADIQKAAATIPRSDFDIISQAAQNIRDFHQNQKETSWFQTKTDGSILGQKVSPVDRAGLYVPGGQGGNTPLISSLLMQAIPAQVAGVEEIAIVSPPRADGTINEFILAAAYMLDIEEVYAIGGPWAIGALAYGTKSIKPVDVITGPGNAYVTTAKKLVQGHVGIDMLAGPSEILILADEYASPDYIAADMLSQAEHDSLASAILVTTSQHLADRVCDRLERRLEKLPRKELAEKSLQDWGAIFVVPNMQIAIQISNKIAPEHMEILTNDPWSYVHAIKHAGALFLGSWSPEPLGDYFAGPNHVLPTQGTARFSSALSVQTFCKKTSIIAASASFTSNNAEIIARLARIEGLEAHALSIESRNPFIKKG